MFLYVFEKKIEKVALPNGLKYTDCMRKLIQKTIIAVLFFVSTLNLFAYSGYSWEKDDYNTDLCRNEEAKSFYERQLQIIFEDDKIELAIMRKVQFNYPVNINIYHVYLSLKSEKYFRKMHYPIGYNSGYCILDDNNQLISLWKNRHEAQKLIKAVNVAELSEVNKKDFISFIYNECMKEDPRGYAGVSTIFESFENLDMLSRDKRRKLHEKYKDFEKPIQISETGIEFYALEGSSFSGFTGEILKVVFTFDEEKGLLMTETVLLREEDFFRI